MRENPWRQKEIGRAREAYEEEGLVTRKGSAQLGEVVIDFDSMEFRRSGRLIHTTDLEFRLLRFLVNHPHRVFSREDLIRAVWPMRERANGRTVDNSILHLRRKLERNPATPVLIQTVYRAGYKFVLPSAPSRIEKGRHSQKRA